MSVEQVGTLVYLGKALTLIKDLVDIIDSYIGLRIWNETSTLVHERS